MATILYTLINGKVEKGMFEARRVSKLLSNGYAVTPDDLVSVKDDEFEKVKEAARAAGIRIGRKSINTLRKELESEQTQS